MDISATANSGSTESSTDSHFATPSASVFDHFQYVKKEGSCSMESETEAFMEHTTKNQETIQTTLSLILATLTNPSS